MKHFWFGAGLLAALLALSLWTMGFLEDIHEPIRQDLDAAAEAVLSGDWNRGRALANQAEDAWEQKRNLIAALSSHLAIEEIDSLFRQLSVYARSGDPIVYAAACRELACLTAAASEAHQLTWWNLL